jgi:hypothetical protein
MIFETISLMHVYANLLAQPERFFKPVGFYF